MRGSPGTDQNKSRNVDIEITCVVHRAVASVYLGPMEPIGPIGPVGTIEPMRRIGPMGPKEPIGPMGPMGS